MQGTIHPGKSPGTDQIQHFVVAVENRALAALQSFDLVIGQKLAAEQQLTKFVDRNAAAPQLAPQFLQLAVGAD